MTDDEASFNEGYDLALAEMARNDLSDCPYYNGTGTCSYGCWDEPQCQTCTPRDGWPTERHPIVVALRAERDALAEQLTAANADAEALSTTGKVMHDAFWHQFAHHTWAGETWQAMVAWEAANLAIRARVDGGAKP